MASIRRSTGTKFYYACYRGADGLRRQVSTKELSRNRAMKIAIELETAAQMRDSRTALQARFNQISQDLYSAPLRSDMTLPNQRSGLCAGLGRLVETFLE